MKLLAALAIIAVLSESVARAGTFHYRISDSPSNSFTYHGGLSGLVVSAAVEGTFSITYEPNAPPFLSSFRLFLVNASANLGPPSFDASDFEGKPIQDFMSHDLQGSPVFGLSAGWSIYFAAPQPTGLEIIRTEPHSTMNFNQDESMTVELYSRLTPVGTLDGPTVTFLPLTTTSIPEPASLGLATFALVGFTAIVRRRKK